MKQSSDPILIGSTSEAALPIESAVDSSLAPLGAAVVASERSSVASTLSKNVALGLARVGLNSLVALVLPAFLAHRLPVATYGAWVLILQLGAFVSYLDLGVQLAVSKFVAEHDAKGDPEKAGKYASAGMTIVSLTALLGVVLTAALAWQVPRLFQNMPGELYHDVRISVLLIGTSLSFGLLCSVFGAVFVGLQRYLIPMGISMLNRGAYTLIVLATVFLHGRLATMGVAVAIVHFSTGFLQVAAWRRYAFHIRLSFRPVDRRVLKEMTSYCFLLGITTLCMLCVSGLDITIVGHYDFSQTAFYSTATMPTNFIISIMLSILGPMMPASAALSTRRSPVEMGALLARVTRYSLLLLLLSGLPLIVFGTPILRLWVGPVYAEHSLLYLRLLICANVLRNIGAPYTTMVVATGRLRAAILSPVVEALVNLGSSVLLALHFGAAGVAFGTLLGALVGLCLHFTISMKLTQETFAVSPLVLLLKSVLRPAILVVPALLLLLWMKASPQSFNLLAAVIVWSSATLVLCWFATLEDGDRLSLTQLLRTKIFRLDNA